jgi:uncharacterized protein (DUF433 family)
MGGTPCIVGTRIPVHLVADMSEGGDSLPATLEAYPRLTPEQVELARLFANAYPLRGRPPLRSWRQKMIPKSTQTYRLDDLPIPSVPTV